MAQVYLNEHIMTVMEDPSALRELDAYQHIKQLINSRYRVFSRHVCWQQVQQECTELAAQTGIDFLCSSYLAVANTKVQGLDGLAWGLELLQSAYLADTTHQSLASFRKREMLEWVANKVINELEEIPASNSHLRALYRCERTLQELYELSQRFQPQEVPNLEAIAFVIFEHIDTLETQFSVTHASQKVAGGKDHGELVQHTRSGFLLTFIALIFVSISVACVLFGIYYLELFGS